jgi:thiol-disulfide isomerase/thioredoxin
VGPFSGRQLAVAFAAIVAAVVLLVAITTPLGNTANGPGTVDPRATAYLLGSPPPVGLKVGQAAPEFAVTADDGSTYQLTDLQGQPIRLADLRGKAVWVNFWTTWCPPCQAEMPILRDLSTRYKDRGLELVAISVQETSPADVATYAQRYGLGYTIGFDGSGRIFRAYKGYGLPTQVFIDPNGVIASIVGAPLDEAAAAAQIERILPAGAVAPSPTTPSPTPRPS